MEAGGSGCLSRWKGNPITVNKEGNWLHKERCVSVSGLQIRWSVRTQRVIGNIQIIFGKGGAELVKT